ncbi:hypothetical protein FQR65_LT03055 [Abscondita terminalis]|nr:hypothetical protein FQR65_LT03055 [Abscondita terminalis]
MNVKCLICSDSFRPHSEIYVTACGHLFHYQCLLQWFERSKTCPQCRAKATEKTIHRLFLSIEENVEAVDPFTLQDKIDRLNFNLKLKDMDIKNAQESHKIAAQQNSGLKEEVKTLEQQNRTLESTMEALKSQVVFFKTKSKELTKIQEELFTLRTKINDYKQIKTMLEGNQEELNEMLRMNPDANSLALLVVTLKKQLMETEKSKNQLQTSVKNLRSETQLHRKKYRSLHEQYSNTLKEVEEHKNCNRERECLKQTIEQLQNQNVQNNSSPKKSNLNRIVTESPIPASTLLNLNKSSPSVLDVVKSVQDSSSPYLRVQTSSVGLSGLINYNQTDLRSERVNKQSIFKKPLKMQTLKRPLSSGAYDGFGGHSKEEHFPSPRRDFPLKKMKSSANATILKFKKLASSQPKHNNQEPK